MLLLVMYFCIFWLVYVVSGLIFISLNVLLKLISGVLVWVGVLICCSLVIYVEQLCSVLFRGMILCNWQYLWGLWVNKFLFSSLFCLVIVCFGVILSIWMLQMDLIVFLVLIVLMKWQLVLRKMIGMFGCILVVRFISIVLVMLEVIMQLYVVYL